MLRKLVMDVAAAPGAWLLHGPPRNGKTTIAVEAGRRLEPGHPVVYLTCRDVEPEKVREFLAPFLALPNPNAVVILDDIRDQKIFKIALELGVRVRVICTSRRKEPGFPAANCIEVKGFTAEEADSLIERSVGVEIHPYRKTWHALGRRVDWSPPALIEARDDIANLDANYARGTVLGRLRDFKASEKERAHWKRAVEELREPAQLLVRAYGACAPQGTYLQLACAIANIPEEERIATNNRLLDAGLVACINPEREYYRLHPMIRMAYRGDQEWDKWRNRHYETLIHWQTSTGSSGMDWRKCLGENAVAARWLSERERFGDIPGLLQNAMEVISHRSPSRDPAGESDLIRRHHYLQGRLWQLWGEPSQTGRHFVEYLRRSRLAGKWRDEAEALALLAFTFLLPPPPPDDDVDLKDKAAREAPDLPPREAVPAAALRLLEEQASLYREYLDYGGEALSLGFRAALLLERDEIDEAELLLETRARLLAQKNMRQPLPRIDEDQGYLLQLWEYLQTEVAMANPWARPFPDELRERMAYQAGKDAGHSAASAIDAALQDRAQTGQTAPYSLPTRPRLIEALTSRYSEVLPLIDKQEQNLREGQDEALCACYANRAAILAFQKEYEKALADLQKQEDLCKRLLDWRGLAECYGSQGAIFWEVEHFRDRATDRFQRKLAIELELHFEEALAFQLWSRGVLEALAPNADARDLATAEGYLVEAGLILDRMGYEEELAKLNEDRDALCRRTSAACTGSP